MEGLEKLKKDMEEALNIIKTNVEQERQNNSLFDNFLNKVENISSEKEYTKFDPGNEESNEEEEYYNFEEEFTPQDIIRQWYITKHTLENLMIDSLGLNHLTDMYKEIMLKEKAECKKALGEDNIEYFELL